MTALFLVVTVLVVVAALLTLLSKRTPADATTTLIIMLGVAMAVPQRFVVVGLDSAGAPARLIGVGLFGLWLLGRTFTPGRLLDQRPNPVIPAVWIFILTVLVRTSIGWMTPEFSSTAEQAGLALLSMFAIAGWAMYASDALPTRKALGRLRTALLVFGSLLALVGLWQWLVGSDPLTSLDLGVLVPAETLEDERFRSAFLRARGTSYHPIEYGVVLAMLLPYAIAAGMCFRGAARRWAYAGAVVMGLAMLLSISRSTVLAGVVAMGVAVISYRGHERLRVLGLGVAGILGVYLTIPGLLGAFRGLILGVGTDSSISARTADYPIAFEFIRQQPIVGVGSGEVTLEVVLLDNAYLGTMISGGFIGLVGLLGLLLIPLVLAWVVMQRAGDDTELRLMAGAIAASLAAATASLATFDGFFFQQFITVLAVDVAMAGAVWRLHDPEPRGAPGLRRVGHEPK